MYVLYFYWPKRYWKKKPNIKISIILICRAAFHNCFDIKYMLINSQIKEKHKHSTVLYSPFFHPLTAGEYGLSFLLHWSLCKNCTTPSISNNSEVKVELSWLPVYTWPLTSNQLVKEKSENNSSSVTQHTFYLKKQEHSK